MNPTLVDPDVKINMSLDEIIRLSREQINGKLPKRNRKRRKNNSKKNSDHSVPLLSSTCGVNIYVSKKSSLLSPEHRRRIIKAVSNRTINFHLLQKSKKIIPAEYKLIKTNKGVERVLVPAPENFSKGISNGINNYSQQEPGYSKSFPDKPPPLMSIPILNPPTKPKSDDEMEVDDQNEEVVVLKNPDVDKKLEVIDLECDAPVDVMDVRKMCSAVHSSSEKKSLNDRFTMLTGSLQF